MPIISSETTYTGGGGSYISTGTGNEFLDVCDFVLLLVVCFGLICLQLLFCADVGVVVATVVDQFAVDGEIHDLGTDVVEEVLRVGGKDETVRVFGEVCFKPDDGFKIEMVRGFVQYQQKRLDE